MVPRPAAVLDGAPFLPLVSHVWKNKGSKGHVWLSVSGGIEKIDGEGKLIGKQAQEICRRGCLPELHKSSASSVERPLAGS